ncbi:NAD(P)H-dependent glycerol-3-phosphate dehydrogenase [Thalassobius sp. S69A]|uniref:NAD(P)H-dependent glycerol-3-phosphate dehydrogenase n=1 Tax=unclassified Thalassovita TaxID=2619711 RepID=UPI000C0FFBB7|nr:glycerol-3-phosphate dehydrogenase [Paracoccaceae bacterium]MBT26968.1 glycerol-3-phosphate dehydrogenase [Paracoccaceae bacterium]
MTRVGVIGAGAFGTALALAQAVRGAPVVLWGRDPAAMAAMHATRTAPALPVVPLPSEILVTPDLGAVAGCEVILLSIPTQALRGFLTDHGAGLGAAVLVACCKGVERGTGLLPTQIIADVLPGVRTAVLTGPSFADDIARGKPTALTLATDLPDGAALQEQLSTPAFRLYLSDDPVGAQLGGALKNVIALAAGMVIGADLGESARAALMTRGFAEITRLAAAQGAHPETLLGLSGFGDLILTCSSEKSRNFSHGIRVARGEADTGGKTVEGVMTAHAVSEQGADMDLPVIHMVSALLKGQVSLAQAMDALLQRPLKSER